MRGRGRRPRRWHGLVGLVLGLGLVASACGGGSGGTTTVTYVGVAGGAISFGMTEAPTGCNPNTPAGDSPGTLTVLAAVLPSPFVVGANGTSTPNSDLIVSAEPVSINPETIVYTLNPKAVWSDGVPITAADFKYAWEEQRGDPETSSPDVTSIAGYRDIASVTGSNGGHTVTVKFKSPFADWQGLFNYLVPAHVMEKIGWNPSCSTVDPNVDLSGGPFKIGSIAGSAITLVQNPKWWGTPANSHSITVHIATSTDQLAQWMSSGYVQVAEPSTVTPAFLTEMTGLPGAYSDVDTSNTMLQLDMDSALASPLSPDLREAIALTVNRQDLVNQQASWAVPGLQVADSHVYVQGQTSYKPVPMSDVPTTTIPVPTSSTSTTVIGGGGSVNFPVTPVPDQAAALVQAAGLVRTPGDPLYHYPFGVPFTFHMIYDASDPWAASAAPVIRDELEAAGMDTTLTASDRRAGGGRGVVRRPGRPGPGAGEFQSVPEPDAGLVHDVAGTTREERLTGLDGLLELLVRPTAADGGAAAEPEHGGHVLRPGGYATVGRDGVLAFVRRTGGTGLEQEDRRRHPDAAQQQPVVVRPAVGRAGSAIDQ